MLRGDVWFGMYLGEPSFMVHGLEQASSIWLWHKLQLLLLHSGLFGHDVKERFLKATDMQLVVGFHECFRMDASSRMLEMYVWWNWDLSRRSSQQFFLFSFFGLFRSMFQKSTSQIIISWSCRGGFFPFGGFLHTSWQCFQLPTTPSNLVSSKLICEGQVFFACRFVCFLKQRNLDAPVFLWAPWSQRDPTNSPTGSRAICKPIQVLAMPAQQFAAGVGRLRLRHVNHEWKIAVIQQQIAQLGNNYVAIAPLLTRVAELRAQIQQRSQLSIWDFAKMLKKNGFPNDADVSCFQSLMAVSFGCCGHAIFVPEFSIIVLFSL